MSATTKSMTTNKMFPILLVDIVGFTSLYKDDVHRKIILKQLGESMDQAGKFISPIMPFSQLFERHGTGDGYYIFLKGISTDVALEYTQKLRHDLVEYNEGIKGGDLPLSLRLVLAYGNVELVGDQYYGSVMADAERLMSEGEFKKFQTASGEPSALFTTMLFRHTLDDELKQSTDFSHLTELKWNRLKIEDKHGHNHIGYIQGDYIPEASSETLIPTEPQEPSVPIEVLRQRYFKNLSTVCNLLPLADIAKSGDPQANLRLTLDQIYIGLNTTTFVDKQGKPAKVNEDRFHFGDDKVRPLTALEAAANEPLLVILGDPGSGKTSFINHLLWQLAERQLNPESVSLKDWPHRHYFPIRVVLRELLVTLQEENSQQYIKSTQEQRLCQFMRIIKKHLQKKLDADGLSGFSSELVRLLEDDRCLLVFDGLDEVPKDDQFLLREVLGILAVGSKGNRIIVTCRILSYVKDTVIATYQTITLAPFSNKQINNFITYWYQALHRLGKPADWAQTKTDNLQQAVGRLPEDMVSNPLLLTTLAGVHTTNVELPRQRVKLYDQAAMLMMKRWQEVRIGQKVSLFDDVGLSDETRMLFALWELGYLAQKAGRDGEQMPDIPWAMAMSSFTKNLSGVVTDSKKAAMKLLDYIDTTSGLLSGRGQDVERVYAFPHRTFQEYFAGCYLAKRTRSFNRTVKELLAEGEYWRLSVELGMEELLFNDGNENPALDLTYSLCPGIPEPKREDDWRGVLWAGHFARIIKRGPIENDKQGGGPQFLTRLNSRLTTLLSEEKLAAHERVDAGLILGWSGDQRSGVCDFDIEMWVDLPGGCFTMGREKAKHDVELTPFKMSRYPITNGQYKMFIDTKGYDDRKWWSEAGWKQRQSNKWVQPEYWDNEEFSSPNQPVIGVSWYEAEAFCSWLTGHLQSESDLPQKTIVQLPTEAEWEYAARGRSDALYPWRNDDISEKYANYSKSNLGKPSAVGSYPSGQTPEGIYDLAGNVWEWCRDWYKSDYYKDSTKKDPEGPDDGRFRVLRGGAWYRDPDSCSCSARIDDAPGGRWDSYGCRVVLRDV